MPINLQHWWEDLTSLRDGNGKLASDHRWIILISADWSWFCLLIIHYELGFHKKSANNILLYLYIYIYGLDGVGKGAAPAPFPTSSIPYIICSKIQQIPNCIFKWVTAAPKLEEPINPYIYMYIYIFLFCM